VIRRTEWSTRSASGRVATRGASGPQPRRPGYTLLEILVASVIGLLLMAALYAAFTIIIDSTSVGRDSTSESNLTRGIFNRMGIDLGSPVGMLGPRSGGDASSSGTAPTADETTPTTGTGSTTASTDGGSTTPVTTGSNIPFQAGLVGTGDQLIIFLSRSPDYIRKRGVPFDPAVLMPSDLVRVTYYLHSSGKGLCRQERPWVTSDGVWNSTDPDRSTEDADRIAPEVINMVLEYASGTGYVGNWDGSAADASGASCQGPPRAVRVTLTLEFTLRDGTTTTKDVTHTYPIRSAIGTGGGVYTPPSTASTDGTTPSTGGTP
jgi:prepilin-type N-terminal cleavage/methylation domain-containing protein